MKHHQKLGNSLQRQQQQQQEGLTSSKSITSTAAKSSNLSNTTNNTSLYPRSTLSNKENYYQLLGTTPAITGTATSTMTTANLLQKKNLPYPINMNTQSSANLLRSPATTATTVNSATSANSELLASTSAAA